LESRSHKALAAPLSWFLQFEVKAKRHRESSAEFVQGLIQMQCNSVADVIIALVVGAACFPAAASLARRRA
jgi:hypothetical protein